MRLGVDYRLPSAQSSDYARDSSLNGLVMRGMLGHTVIRIVKRQDRPRHNWQHLKLVRQCGKCGNALAASGMLAFAGQQFLWTLGKPIPAGTGEILPRPRHADQ